MRPAPYHPAAVANARILDRIESRQAAIAAAAKPAASQPSTTTSQPAASLPANLSPALGRILRPQGAYRWLLPQLAAITPQYIEMVLRGALAGNHVQQWELFDLMIDTWPELASCAAELTEGVLEFKPIFSPWADEDEKPTPDAIERCKLVSAAMRRMRPSIAKDENDLAGTIKDLADGWFRGVTVLEVDWQSIKAGSLGQIIAPRATFWVHPVCFAWSQDGELGLRTDAAGAVNSASLSGVTYQAIPGNVGTFPPHKFLVGIHKAKSGTALGGALLRPLAWWWCAANFASDWVLNLAQVFGLPFRWANFDPNAPQATIDAICTMLQNMGSAGWAAFPAGTTLDLKDVGKGSDHSPQGELLDRADRYARMLILGQTMSGSHGTMGKGGGQAFGAVEKDVKVQRIAACREYIASMLNAQLVPSICMLNYGDTDLCPSISFPDKSQGDLQMAQTLQVLSAAGVKIPQGWARDLFEIPEPEEGEDVLTAPAVKQSDAGTRGRGDGSAAPGAQEEDVAMEAKDDPFAANLDDAFLAALRKTGGGSLASAVDHLRALDAISDDAAFAAQLKALAGQTDHA